VVAIPSAPPPPRAAPVPADDNRPVEALLDIGRAVRAGIKWKAVTQVVSEASRVVVALILARLLTPGDYGIAGMAMVCVSFATLFCDPALGTALVQRRHIDEADRSTVFWTTLVTAVLAAGAGVALSGYVADAFGHHEVRKLFIVLMIGLVLSGLSVTQLALLVRGLSYRSIEIREIGATLVGAVVAVAVAVAGFGAWAIIANWLVFTAVSTALLWFLSPWRPSLTFSRRSLTDLGGYGSRVFGARVLGWANSNMDNVLVGRYLGASALGAYALAYNIMYLPITRISVPLTGVFSPAYARMSDDPELLKRSALRSKELLALLLAPAFAICIVVAPDLVPVAFGEKWHAAVVPVQLLCVAGLAQVLTSLHWSILTALDRPGTLLRINVVVTVLTVGAFVAGLPFGIVGVAAFYAGVRAVLVLIDTWLTARAVRWPFWPTLIAGLPALPLAVLAGALGLGARALLVDAGVPAFVRILLVGAVIAGAYLLLVRLAIPRAIGEIRSALRQKKA